jgi:uncharacterized YkwD family protein
MVGSHSLIRIRQLTSQAPKEDFVLIFKKAVVTSALLAGSLFATGVASAASYTVKDGDNFSRIAQIHGINMYKLASFNGHIADINFMVNGMKVTIPNDYFRLFVQAPQQTAAKKTQPVVVNKPQPAPQSQPKAQPVQKQPVQKAAQPAAKAPAAPASVSQYSKDVLALVNQQRANAGLKALTLDSKLSVMALDKAKDMYNKNYFDHNSPTYGSPFDMMKAYGISYRYAGENIAKGQQSPGQVMNDWMNSPGHRANILNGNFTKIGLAYYNGEWVQEFIG